MLSVRWCLFTIEGHLFFGYLNFDDNQAIFFVIHLSDWYPYQHRFKTNSFTSFFNSSISPGAETGETSVPVIFSQERADDDEP